MRPSASRFLVCESCLWTFDSALCKGNRRSQDLCQLRTTQTQKRRIHSSSPPVNFERSVRAVEDLYAKPHSLWTPDCFRGYSRGMLYSNLSWDTGFLKAFKYMMYCHSVLPLLLKYLTNADYLMSRSHVTSNSTLIVVNDLVYVGVNLKRGMLHKNFTYLITVILLDNEYSLFFFFGCKCVV
jgi:hypothetical protein